MDITNTQLLCGKIFFNASVTEFSISCSFCEEIFQKVIMLMEHLVDNHYFSLNPFDLKSEIEIYDDQENLIKELFMAKKEISSEKLDKSDFTTNTLEDIRKEISEIKTNSHQNNSENSDIVRNEYSKIEIEVLCENSKDEFSDCDSKYDSAEEDYIEPDEHSELQQDKILNEDLNASMLWKCHLCKKILRRSSKPSHLKHIHGGKKPNFRCIFCDLNFDTVNKLWAHKKEHTGQDQYCFKCPQCPKSYKTKGAVKDHHKRVHLKINKYHCGFCDKKFYTSAEKNVHEMLNHNQERPKVCHMCGERFVNTQRLNNHFSRKHSDVTYDCPKCNKKFKMKSHLVCHLKQTHTNERLFECKPCGKSFKYKRGLRKHNVVVHVGERNCICKLCGKAFPTTSHISCHMKSHRIPYSRNNCIFKKDKIE